MHLCTSDSESDCNSNFTEQMYLVGIGDNVNGDECAECNSNCEKIHRSMSRF